MILNLLGKKYLYMRENVNFYFFNEKYEIITNKIVVRKTYVFKFVGNKLIKSFVLVLLFSRVDALAQTSRGVTFDDADDANNIIS